MGSARTANAARLITRSVRPSLARPPSPRRGTSRTQLTDDFSLPPSSSAHAHDRRHQLRLGLGPVQPHWRPHLARVPDPPRSSHAQGPARPPRPLSELPRRFLVRCAPGLRELRWRGSAARGGRGRGRPGQGRGRAPVEARRGDRQRSAAAATGSLGWRRGPWTRRQRRQPHQAGRAQLQK